MRESVLIEVDEMTKGILETLEERMFDGARQAVDDGKHEIIDRIDSAKMALLQGIDGSMKQSKAVRDQMEHVHDDVQRVLRHAEDVQGVGRVLNEQLKQLVEQTADHSEKLHGAILALAHQLMEQRNSQAEQTAQLADMCKQLVAKINALEEQVEWNAQPFWKRLFGRKTK